MRVRPASRRRDEDGFVTVVAVALLSTLLFGLCALGVDVARWWLEAQRVQAAADAAALGSVTFVPMDPASADQSAKEIAARNGYTNGTAGASVTSAPGTKASQLRVTVCGKVTNGFGAVIGLTETTVCRTALADYTGPAPMGSPCNTFGNEPDSGGGSAPLPTGTVQGSAPATNCKKYPQFWAVAAGPADDKGNGDQYGTLKCGDTRYDGCESDGTNSEYADEGYFWVVHVEKSVVDAGKTIDLQVYDPQYTPTVNGSNPCGNIPSNSSWSSTPNPNPYVTTGDAAKRYGSTVGNAGTTTAPFCTGDLAYKSNVTRTVTSFALRQQTDTQRPSLAPVQSGTDGMSCIRQFGGTSALGTTSTAALNSKTDSYNKGLAATFHNWYSLCTFTPKRAGDYYLQVRTNVALGGTAVANTNGNNPVIYNGNTNVLKDTGNLSVGSGANVFALRAHVPGSEDQVSVSGFDRMPIYANGTSTSSLFNLIRVLPAGASKSIQFRFYDVGDATGSGTVTVLPPDDATTTDNNQKLKDQSYSVQFPGGCPATGGNAGSTGQTYANCSAPIQGGSGGANNGHVQTLVVPIPNKYMCEYAKLSGCWYQVRVAFNNGANVTDLTTWTANITGDPVRLIE